MYPQSGGPYPRTVLGSQVSRALRRTDDACRELDRLAQVLSRQRGWLRRCYLDALRAKRRNLWTPPDPVIVGTLLDNASARMISDEHDLLEVVLESLDRFQHRLTKGQPPMATLLWNYTGSGNRRKDFRPKDEEDISDFIANWLRDDLSPTAKVVIGREVQPRRGQRTDIRVDAIPCCPAGVTARPLTIVIEVKGCWHPAVRTAIRTQLVEDYLINNGLTHGIYLVGWFVCERWNVQKSRRRTCLKSRTYADACSEVQELAHPFAGEHAEVFVKGVCLDCRFPNSPGSRCRAASSTPESS
jgi:hypothetical protein